MTMPSPVPPPLSPVPDGPTAAQKARQAALLALLMTLATATGHAVERKWPAYKGWVDKALSWLGP